MRGCRLMWRSEEGDWWVESKEVGVGAMVRIG